MADRTFHHGRHAGVLVPLFSIPSRASWGVGEIADLPLFARWLSAAGLDLVQLLPVNEMEEGQNSPYSALSAMAIDPVFIALRDVEEFAEAGGEAALDPADRARLEGARRRAAVDFRTVRALKRVALHLAFHVFRERLAAGTARAVEFQAFAERERWWLDDYALFRALHDEHHGCYWRDWEPELRDRDPLALDRARQRLADTILYYQYLQWLADNQWRRARARVRPRRDLRRLSLHGQRAQRRRLVPAAQFRIDASVGVPPDAFSETGQDWGLPVYRWDAMRHDDYDWLRQRARRCTDLYDGFRVDHLVGFYRTYVRERDGHNYFMPVRRAVADGAGGTHPRPVPRARRPHHRRGPRRRPRLRPGVAGTGEGARVEGAALGARMAHAGSALQAARTITPPNRWRSAARTTPTRSRSGGTAPIDASAHLCAEIPGLREAGCDPDAPFDDRLRDALLQALFRAGSDIVIVPFQDLFGWRDRVNVPARRQRRELDVAAALADRRSGHAARSARARRISQRAGAGVRRWQSRLQLQLPMPAPIVPAIAQAGRSRRTRPHYESRGVGS